MSKIIGVVLCLFFSTAINAQKIVSGKIHNPQGEVIPNVYVIEQGKQNGVVSDDSGLFSIRVSDNATLEFSFVGMQSQAVTVGKEFVINVVMEPDNVSLDEFMVTALGIKRQQRELGYAAQTIKASEVTKSMPVDLAQGLQGKITGLNISQSNGIADASSRMVIRGNNSLFGRNTPLIVVDGVIVDNKELDFGNVGTNQEKYRDWGNYLSFLDMSAVEDITVLKGPNSAALYGSKGANGVVLITSKKGAKRKGAGIKYSASYVVSDVNRFMDVQNEYGGGFRAGLWTANPELPKTAEGIPFPATLYPARQMGNYYTGFSGVESLHGEVPGGYNSQDIYSWFAASSSWGPKLDGTMAQWWDGEMRPYSPQPDNREYMFKKGIDRVHNLSFSTANDFGSIRLGLLHKNSDAVIDHTSSERTNFSLGSHVKISDILSADINAAYNQSYRKNTPEIGNNYSWSKFMIFGMTRDYRGLEKDFYKLDDGYDGYRNNVFATGPYPYKEYSKSMFWHIYENNDYLWRDELLSTIKIKAELTPWLKAFVRSSVDFVSNRFEEVNNTSQADGITGGYFRKVLSKEKTYNTDLMATLHKEDFISNGLNISLTAGYNSYKKDNNSVDGRNWSPFKVPDVYALSNFTNKDKTKVLETRYDVMSYAYLALLNVSYKNYLFLELTGREDHSSTLPEENNTTFYPSASSSFVFTEALNLGAVENIVNHGALRLAIGKSANAAEPYQLDNTYNTGTFGNVTTIYRPETVPPIDLTFQTSESKEVGLALGLFRNRINLDMTYYHIRSQNQIMTSAVSLASGASKATFNSGELTNEGFEFMLDANIVSRRYFSWNFSFNGATNVNKVVSLADGIQEQYLASVFGSRGAYIKVTPGEKYGTIYGTDFEYDEHGRKQVLNIYDKNDPTEVVATQYKVTDNPVPIGNTNPRLRGGVNNRLRYKNLSLSAWIDYKIGGDIYSFDHAIAMGSGLAPETAEARKGGGLPYTLPDGTTANVGMIMKGWNVDDIRENDRVISPTNYYGITYAGWSHLNRPRSLSVFENSYVKLREVTISYTIPDKLLAKTKLIQDLSFSLVGRNLCYLYSSLPMHLNPEAINSTGNGQGLQWSAFPGIRSVGFTLNAGF